MKIKLIIALLLSAALIPNSYSALNQWQWAKGFGFEGPVPNEFDDEDGLPFLSVDSNAIVADKDGNTYITGSFEGLCTWGNITFASMHYTDPFDENQHIVCLSAFVAKYDVDGNPVWVRKIDAQGGATGKGIALDEKGNIYVCGVFSKVAIFDLLKGVVLDGTDKLPPLWGTKAESFIAKYNNGGQILWAREVENPTPNEPPLGPGVNVASAIAVDAAGNSYITGKFSMKAQFGDFLLKCDSSGEDMQEIYVAKYDTNGKEQWARQAGSSNSKYGPDEGLGIAVSKKGKGFVYVTGRFVKKADFSGISLLCSDKGQMFVACYDSSGTIQWAKQGKSLLPPYDGYSIGNAIAADDDGNCYVTGCFSGSFKLDSISMNSDPGSPQEYSEDAFVAKYDIFGNPLWAKKEGGGDSYQIGRGISLDIPSNSVYVAGNCYEKIIFSDGTTTMFDVQTHAQYGTFIIHYNLNGNILSKKRVMPTAYLGVSEATSITHSGTWPNASFYITGNYSGQPAIFENQLNNPGAGGITLLPYVPAADEDAQGREGAFVAKYSSGVVIQPDLLSTERLILDRK